MVAGPVGRAELWSRLTGRLDEPAGSVILIAGEPGSGRSHLLRKFGEQAAARGLPTVGCTDSIGVEKTTKLADMARVLASMLDTDPGPATRPPAEHGRWLRQLLDTLSNATQPEREVFDMLAAAAPIVIGIDGYTPSNTLDLWFATRLIPRVRAATEQTILVITGQRSALATLEPVATETLELGSLDRAEVIAHLSALGADLAPPVTDAELAGYYQSVAEDPRLLRGLSTVFRAVAERGC